MPVASQQHANQQAGDGSVMVVVGETHAHRRHGQTLDEQFPADDVPHGIQPHAIFSADRGPLHDAHLPLAMDAPQDPQCADAIDFQFSNMYGVRNRHGSSM